MSRLAAIVVVGIAAAFFAMDLIFGGFNAFIAVPLALLPFPVVGALLIVRVPRNPVGYLLSLSGLLFASVFALSIYAQTALVSEPALPWGDVAAAVSDASFIPAVACIVLMLLFFPSGRGLGGRWTWIEAALIAFVVALSVGGLLNDKTIEFESSGGAVLRIQNPLAIDGPLAGVIAFFAALGDPSVVVVLLGPLSLFVRYRRSSPIERQQIKWLAYSATLALVLLVASNIAPAIGDSAWPVVIVAFGLIPITIGIAVLRYRLYDIDVLIRRTLVYATLSAVLLGSYVGVVALLETFLAPITAGNGSPWRSRRSRSSRFSSRSGAESRPGWTSVFTVPATVPSARSTGLRRGCAIRSTSTRSSGSSSRPSGRPSTPHTPACGSGRTTRRDLEPRQRRGRNFLTGAPIA